MRPTLLKIHLLSFNECFSAPPSSHKTKHNKSTVFLTTKLSLWIQFQHSLHFESLPPSAFHLGQNYKYVSSLIPVCLLLLLSFHVRQNVCSAEWRLWNHTCCENLFKLVPSLCLSFITDSYHHYVQLLLLSTHNYMLEFSFSTSFEVRHRHMTNFVWWNVSRNTMHHFQRKRSSLPDCLFLLQRDPEMYFKLGSLSACIPVRFQWV